MKKIKFKDKEKLFNCSIKESLDDIIDDKLYHKLKEKYGIAYQEKSRKGRADNLQAY
jgi:hypothetical protein